MAEMGGLIDLISHGGSYGVGLENDRVRAATELARSQTAIQEEEKLKLQREAEAQKRAQADQNILTMAMREPGMNRKRMGEYLLQKMSPAGYHNWLKQDMEMAKSAASLDDSERKKQTDLHTKAGQILAAVAASKDPGAAYGQAHPQLQELGSDYKFPEPEGFDKDHLPFMIGALGYADDFLKQRQGEATIAKTEEEIKTAAQKLLDSQRDTFVGQLTPDMTDEQYQQLRANSPPQVANRFPAKIGEWIPRALKTAIAVKDRAKAEQEALVLAGMSPEGVTAAKQADLLADEAAKAEQARHNRASESLTARGQNMADSRAGQAREDRPITEGESKAYGFFKRLDSASKVLSTLDEAMAKKGVGAQAFQKYAPNVLQSDENQSFEQARRMFTEAYLRRESGAVISKSEEDGVAKAYFPQPGDGSAVLEQKKAARKVALDALGAEAGRALKKFDGAKAEAPKPADPLGIR